jgi:hypothetical protein
MDCLVDSVSAESEGLVYRVPGLGYHVAEQ